MLPRIVYFSSVTENTKIFIERLPFASTRIHLRSHDERVEVDYPFIFVVPTYGGGRGEAAVPHQVKQFFSNPTHRELCVGVIGSGNLNFGEKYAIAGDILARKLGVPMLYRFELRGTKDDEKKLSKAIADNWLRLLSLRGLETIVAE